MNKSAPSIDYQAWPYPLHDHATFHSALSSGLDGDGLHRIWFGGESLDLLLQGTDSPRAQGKALLVVFGGAVAARQGKRAPFFSGMGLARSLGLPLLAVSDPTLARNADIALGWYAGNDNITNLPDKIAQIINELTRKHEYTPLLLGFSGGGFAALSILSKLRPPATSVVWNPQTSISEYVPRTVEEYLRTAFPNLTPIPTTSDELLLRASLRARLIEAGVAESVQAGAGHDQLRLLYLQNRTDWHTLKHAAPFVKSIPWRRIGPRSFRSLSNSAACWFGDWGHGHSVPPYDMVKQSLADLAGGCETESVARQLDHYSAGREVPITWFDVDGTPTLSIVDIRRGDDFVEANCRLGTHLPSGARMEFAYYLVNQEGRIATRWYKDESRVRFDLPATGSPFHLLAFVRDNMGTVVSTKAAVAEEAMLGRV